MTAQGGDLLAWLDDAITQREGTARDASDGPWWVEHPRTVWGPGPDIEVATSGGTVAALPEDGNGMLNALHVVANDPESVLRRCAADRRLIAEHGPFSERDWGCKGCGLNGHEELITGHYEDCPVLNAIAEGYGWTGAER